MNRFLPDTLIKKIKVHTAYSIPVLLATIILVLSMAQTGMAQSILPSLGDDRSGTAGFQFSKINVDPRSAAMGGSSIATATDPSSLYWNPALASQIEGTQLMASHTAYFVDISMEYLSYVQKLGPLTVGASVQYLNSGEMEETTEFEQFGTGRTFRTIHYTAGLTASQRLTDLFSYGITLRYFKERIEEVDISTAAVDLGFYYKVGDTGLRMAVGLNNFGFDANPSGSTIRTTLQGPVEATSFDNVSLPTRFNLGVAYDVIESENYNLLVTSQITNPSDNSERFSMGGELTFMDQFFLRTGYSFGQEELDIPSIGAGFEIPYAGRALKIDYGFTNFERLGNLHRFGLIVKL